MNILKKTPFERTRVYVDFSNELSGIEALSAMTVTCVNAADGTDSLATIVSSSARWSSEALLLVMGGVVGERHIITVTVDTTYYNTFQEELIIDIAEENSGSFTKQPADIFSVKFDFANDFDPDIELIEVGSVNISAIDRDTGNVAAVVSGHIVDRTAIVFGVVGGIDGHEYDISLRVHGDHEAMWAPQQYVEKFVIMKVRET